jgi:hypothetical protein
MSVVHLPTCAICKSMMRQVRVRERDETTYRVFECVRCHAELMWTPGVIRSAEVTRDKSTASRSAPVIGKG